MIFVASIFRTSIRTHSEPVLNSVSYEKVWQVFRKSDSTVYGSYFNQFNALISILLVYSCELLGSPVKRSLSDVHRVSGFLSSSAELFCSQVYSRTPGKYNTYIGLHTYIHTRALQTTVRIYHIRGDEMITRTNRFSVGIWMTTMLMTSLPAADCSIRSCRCSGECSIASVPK